MTLNINTSVESLATPTYKRYSFSRSRSSLSQVDQASVVVEVNETGVKVPLGLVQCFNYIQSHGMVEGIFRVNGSVKRINQYYGNVGGEGLETSHASPHDVSGVIKRYLNHFLNDGSIFDAGTTREARGLYEDYQAQMLVDGWDDTSVESFKTARTSYDNDALNEFLEKFVQLIAGERSQEKNHLFVYLVHNLNMVMRHSQKTKMSSTNLAIIFQPYVFESDITTIQALPLLQEILLTLIENSLRLVSEYALVAANLQDSNSLSSIDSPITSNGNINETFAGPDYATRRRSMSHRFSTLLDNYYSPIGTTAKSKRFSISFDQLSKSKSSDKSVDPKMMGLKSTADLADFRNENRFPTPVVHSVPSATQARKKSNRKSFISLFKSLSLLSVDSNDVDLPIYGHLNNSMDSVISKNRVMNDQENVLKRNFSLRIRTKKF